MPGRGFSKSVSDERRVAPADESAIGYAAKGGGYRKRGYGGKLPWSMQTTMPNYHANYANASRYVFIARLRFELSLSLKQ